MPCRTDNKLQYEVAAVYAIKLSPQILTFSDLLTEILMVL